MSVEYIDDRDPAIVYSQAPPPGWDWDQTVSGVPGSEYMGTTTLSQRKGATATYSFIGTSIVVYGTIVPNATIGQASSFTIDGGPPQFYFAPAVSQAAYWTAFFQSATLPAGNHTLVIRNELDNDSLRLDVLEVTHTQAITSYPFVGSSISTYSPSPTSSVETTSPTTSMSSSSEASTSSSTSVLSPMAAITSSSSSSQPLVASSASMPSSTFDILPTTSPTNIQSDRSQSSSKLNGAFIGGAVGALILLAIWIGLIAWYCTKRRLRHEREVAQQFESPPAYRSAGARLWRPGGDEAVTKRAAAGFLNLCPENWNTSSSDVLVGRSPISGYSYGTRLYTEKREEIWGDHDVEAVGPNDLPPYRRSYL